MQILANLDTGKIDKSYTRKDYLSDLIDWDQADEDLRAALQPTMQVVVLTAGQMALDAVATTATVFDPFTAPLIEYFQGRSTKIAKDVNDETAKQIRASLSQGVQAGESAPQLTARVSLIMGNAATIRADRIARTEVTRAQGFADIGAWSQSGVVTGKEWYTALDERVCVFCNALNGKVYGLKENFFAKGESMSVDGQTQHYNYDDIPSPGLHPNCRCVLLPVKA